MEPFEGNGVFWRVEHPDQQLAGHFAYDPKNGATLELIRIFGGFGGRGEVMGSAVSHTLCGVIPGRRLVILNAIQNGITVGSETDSER